MPRELSRKELFSGLFDFLREARQEVSRPATLPPERLLRPPGALFPDPQYLAACTGCEKCVPACQQEAIFMAQADPASDKRVAVIVPERKPCYLCTELPCIAACPDGALRSLGSPRQVRMGVAQVDPRICRPFRGEACDLCLRFCPLPDEAIRFINGRPIVVHEICTGCGMCEAACPERPRAIRVVPERELIPGVRLPKVLPGGRRVG